VAPFGAFALAVAIATACGGKSVLVSDDSAAGEGNTGGTGGAVTGGKGGKGGKGGTGGTGGGSQSVGGSGGGGGSLPVAGGSGGRGGSSGRGGGGSAGVGGRSVGGRAGSAGFAGFAGFSGFGNAGGVPIAGTGGFAGFSGFSGFSGFAGFAGSGVPCDACDDADVCTDDLCTQIGMCVYRFNSASCDDGDACTTTEHCVMGACLPGEPVSCDDNEACTIDACDSTLGCSHTPFGVAVDETDRNIPERDVACGPPQNTAVSVVSLADTGNVVWVTAELDLEHPYAGDISVELAHGGASVTLLDRFPGDGSLSSNFAGTYTFALTGRMFEQLGTDATIPSDVYASLESLDAFKGLPAAGDWTLTVSDWCHDDKGTLWGWRLQVGSSCTGASACAGTCDVGVCECGVP
jgi:subtilisin-like proprotein convertase family protein